MTHLLGPVVAALIFLDATLVTLPEFDEEDVNEYEEVGEDILTKIKEIEHSPNWKKVPQNDVQKLREGRQTTFRGSIELDVPPAMIFEELWYRGAETPKWNPDVESAMELINITDNAKITYQTSAPQANGIVSGRDFVTLSYYSIEDSKYYIVYKSVEYEGKPEVEDYVRAENGPSAMVFYQLGGDNDKTLFTWYMNTDFKLSWMGSIVKRLFPSFVVNYLHALRNRMEELKDI